MKLLDSDHDGKISVTEFIAYLRTGQAKEEDTDAVSKFIDQEAVHLSTEDMDDAPFVEGYRQLRIRKRDKIKHFAKNIIWSFTSKNNCDIDSDNPPSNQHS